MYKCINITGMIKKVFDCKVVDVNIPVDSISKTQQIYFLKNKLIDDNNNLTPEGIKLYKQYKENKKVLKEKGVDIDKFKFNKRIININSYEDKRYSKNYIATKHFAFKETPTEEFIKNSYQKLKDSQITKCFYKPSSIEVKPIKVFMIYDYYYVLFTDGKEFSYIQLDYYKLVVSKIKDVTFKISNENVKFPQIQFFTDGEFKGLIMPMKYKRNSLDKFKN